MSDASIIELNDDSFGAFVAGAAQPVLVDFYTQHCPPCRMLAPTIEQLAQDLGGQVFVCKLDAEANQRTAMKFGIHAVPTVIIFKEGRPVASVRGYQAKQRYLDELRRIAG